MIKNIPAWPLPSNEVLNNLNSDETSGLSSSQVLALEQEFGPNEIQTSRKMSPCKLWYGEITRRKDVLKNWR